MNSISAKRASGKISMAELQVSKRRGSNDDRNNDAHPHIVIIGAPGSSKDPIADAIITVFPNVYEKMRSLTNRTPQSLSDRDNHLFTNFLGGNTIGIWWKRFLDELKKHWYFLIDKPMKAGIRDEAIPITESLVRIGSTMYASDYNELQRIILSGKKIVAVTSIIGAKALQQVLGNVYIVCVTTSRHNRHQNLSARYALYPDYQERLRAVLEFGDREVAQLPTSGLTYTTVKIEKNVFTVAEEIVYAAETKALELA